MLDLVQQALELEGYRITRIDGQKSLRDRGNSISEFNHDSTCTIMLASIGSAGEGYVIYHIQPQFRVFLTLFG